MCRHNAFVSDMSCITMPSEFCGQSKRGAQILSVTLHSEFHLIGRTEVAEAGLVFLMPLQLFLTECEKWVNDALELVCGYNKLLTVHVNLIFPVNILSTKIVMLS